MEQELYPFSSESEKTLFNKLSKELKCTVCQNQSLFDSKAPAALILRQEIYQQVLKGKLEQEIINAMVSQHGDTLLYRPELKPGTYILWGAPLFMVVLGCFCLAKLLRG